MGKSSSSSSWSDTTSGYRFSLVSGAISCGVVFLINLSVTIWAATLPDYDADGPDGGAGRRVMFEGSCETSKNLNTGLHLLINLLSCILLGASNYGIQCLSAPTREMVDKAHAKGSWLDIGIVSVRNLKHQTRLTRFLWVALIVSSIPLHLLYNSVVFSSLTVPNEYYVIRLDEPIQASLDNFQDIPPDSTIFGGVPTVLKQLDEPEKFDNLTVTECIDQYAVSFLTTRRDLFLIHEAPEDGNSTGQVEVQGNNEEMFDWVCRDLDLGGDDPCQAHVDEVKSNSTGWMPWGKKVKYCLSRRIEQQLCRVSFSLYMAIGVILSNFAKMSILIYIARFLAPDRLFVLGDAIESFVSDPDVHTAQSCLASVENIRAAAEVNGRRVDWRGPRVFAPTRKRWASPVGKTHIGVGLFLYAGAVLVCLILLIWGITALKINKDFPTLWSLGFGQPNASTMVSWPLGGNYIDPDIATNATIANLPHLIFSIIYFQWNAMLTLMSLAREWSAFYLNRTTLRVSSDPQGQQRSHYFLQLPYKLSMPLILMSALIHWILSQSIFVVSVESVDEHGEWNSWDTLTFGYSPIAIITLLLVSIVMPLSVFLIGRQKLSGSMPVAGSCSLAIAAACHYTDGKGHPEAVFSGLAWGVMGHELSSAPVMNRQDDDGEVREQLLPPSKHYRHCGFSEDHVDEPEEGVTYA